MRWQNLEAVAVPSSVWCAYYYFWKYVYIYWHATKQTCLKYFFLMLTADTALTPNPKGLKRSICIWSSHCCSSLVLRELCLWQTRRTLVRLLWEDYADGSSLPRIQSSIGYSSIYLTTAIYMLRRETWEQTKKYNRPRCAVCCHGLFGAEKWWSSLVGAGKVFRSEGSQPLDDDASFHGRRRLQRWGRTPRVFRHDQSRKEKSYPKWIAIKRPKA